MKITVFVPGPEWRRSAGARIRYDRLADALTEQGHRIAFQQIAEINSEDEVETDVAIFCKTYDIRSGLLARALRARGCRVGIDIFDDYFSQADDSRFVHLRRWFRSMIPLLDFALCATPVMAARFRDLAPGLPHQVVNDPAPDFDMGEADISLAGSIERTKVTGVLDFAWFGMGDNPYFRLGLADLCAFRDALAACRNRGYRARINVLTNRRALTRDQLAGLSRLGPDLHLNEWTPDREQRLIKRSLISFLPVNGHAFSTVKSLNRGITALVGGSQVLSAGFPLYAPLDPFVYRDLDRLIDDLEKDRLRLRSDTLPALQNRLADIGNPDHEARQLIRFLEAVPTPATGPWPAPEQVAIVLHGVVSTGALSKAVRRFNCLSVALPDSRMPLNFDIFPTRRTDGGLDLELTKSAYNALRPTAQARTQRAGKRNGRPLFRITLEPAEIEFPLGPEAPEGPGFQLVDLASYPARVAQIHAAMAVLFDRPEIFLSEQAAPYWGPARTEPPVGTQQVTG